MNLVFFHHRRRDTLFFCPSGDPPALPEQKQWRAGGDGQKICTFGNTNTTYWNEDFRYAPALILFVCRRLPANEKNISQ
jgi:hypothetical protein